MPFISSSFLPTVVVDRSKLSSSSLRSRKRPRNSQPSFRRTRVTSATPPPDAAPRERSPTTLSDTSPDNNNSTPFSWTEAWYPLCIERDAPVDSPLALMLFEKPLVLFLESPGNWVVLDDKCSHRLAPLSEGRITTSASGLQELECAYHGWSFNGCGSCTRIPQLDSGASIPKNASVRRYATRVEFGVIWVYLGIEANAASKTLPVPDCIYSNLEPQVQQNPSNTYARYLPYGLEMFIENTSDPEHVHFAHHGASSMFNRKRGGIRWVTASPFGSDERDGNGSSSISAKIDKSDGGFIAPCTTHYNVVVPGIVETVQVFMAIPVTRDTSRTFVVSFVQFSSTGRNNNKKKLLPFFVPILRRLKPLWAEHLVNNILLDGDMAFLRKIQERLENPRSWKDEYLTVQKTDDWIIQVRKFFDHHRDDMPWPASGVTMPVVGGDNNNNNNMLLDRFHSHTEHCQICLGAYKGFSRAAVVSSLIAKVAITALISVLVSAYLGNPAVLKGERMRTVRNAVILLCTIIVAALRSQKTLTWYKQQFVLSEEARQRFLNT